MGPGFVGRSTLVLVSALALTGCLSSPTVRVVPPMDEVASTLSFGASTDVLSPCPACYEPAVAVDPQGRIFVAANNLGGVAASLDGGATFTIKPCPAPASPFDGSGVFEPGGASDDEVQVAPWGTMFYTELWSDTGGVAGGGVHVASSDDAGETWKTNSVILLRTQPGSRAIISDRQWLAFEPDRTVHLIFNGLLSTLIYDMASHDEGKTWDDPVVVVTSAEHTNPSPTGLPFVDQSGTIVVPYWTDPIPYPSTDPQVTAQGMAVSYSTDHGKTYRSSKVFKHTGTDGANGGAWPAATFLANGTWVAGWDTRADELYLSFSQDLGGHWSRPLVFGKDVTQGLSHPWLQGRGDGGLDVVWFSRNETGPVVRLGRLHVDGVFTTAAVDDLGGGNSDYPFFDHTPDDRVATAYLSPGCSADDCRLRLAITER